MRSHVSREETTHTVSNYHDSATVGAELLCVFGIA